MEVAMELASEERYRWEIEEAGRCLREGRGESALVTHDLTVGVMRVLEQALTQVRDKNEGNVQP